jgi:hypothetical protein
MGKTAAVASVPAQTSLLRRASRHASHRALPGACSCSSRRAGFETWPAGAPPAPSRTKPLPSKSTSRLHGTDRKFLKIHPNPHPQTYESREHTSPRRDFADGSAAGQLNRRRIRRRREGFDPEVTRGIRSGATRKE